MAGGTDDQNRSKEIGWKQQTTKATQVGKPNHRGAGSFRDIALWENLQLPLFQNTNVDIAWFILSWKGFLAQILESQGLCTLNPNSTTVYYQQPSVCWNSISPRLPKPAKPSSKPHITGSYEEVLEIWNSQRIRLKESFFCMLSNFRSIHHTCWVPAWNGQLKPSQPYLGLALMWR